MPLTTVERPKQEWKIGSFGSASRTWHVFGSTDIEDISAEILSVAPADWLLLGRDDDNITISEMGHAAWMCSVPYNKASYDAGLPPASFSFRIGGRSQKIYEAPVISTTAASGMTAKNFRGGINVDQKGKVDGTDIPARGFTFEMEHWITTGALTNSYLSTLVSTCTRYNNASFRGFAAGEVLYLGCTGTQDAGGKYRLYHQFEASPNITSGSVANGQITGVNKKGWEYLWVSWAPTVESNQSTLKPIAAYVHGWTTSADFSLLGIET